MHVEGRRETEESEGRTKSLGVRMKMGRIGVVVNNDLVARLDHFFRPYYVMQKKWEEKKVRQAITLRDLK